MEEKLGEQLQDGILFGAIREDKNDLPWGHNGKIYYAGVLKNDMF